MDDGVVISTSPFKHVYTGIDKTVKRALPLEIIKQLKNLDLSLNPRMELARDMFLFSFYTRGMSFIDMAQLTLGNLQGGVLTYRRQKTSQQLHIKWEPAMQEIVAKYMTDDSPYLRRCGVSLHHFFNIHNNNIAVRHCNYYKTLGIV